MKTLVVSAALVLATGRPAPAKPLPLPPEAQEKVNLAIDQGVRFLKRTQTRLGTWAVDLNAHPVGYAALPGLTLLECGVPADDPGVKKAAAFVRLNALKRERTYEIALSLLFLDRLGDPKDKALIARLAARLIAGQTPTGGWSYKCPAVGARHQRLLFSVLRKLDQAAKAPEKQAESKPKKKRPRVSIPDELRGLPVLQNPSSLELVDPKDKTEEPMFGTTDNSNTQFAILALWAARRHGVPVERTLRLIVRRFTTSQNADGAWGYRYRVGGGEGGTPAMTAVGLLGLAVGHGLADDPAKAKKALDPRTVAGFVALTRHVGVPAGRLRDLPMVSLYFLWSVERVGVLYDLPTIGNKDWYRWGAEILVANQQGAGNWDKGGYPGASPTVDTCMALLFLKRVNLASDLTSRMAPQSRELSMEIASKLPTTSPKEPPRLEKSPPSPPSLAPVKEAAADPPPANDPPVQSAALSPSPSPPPPQKEENEGGSSTGLVLGLCLLGFLLVVGGILLVLYLNKKTEGKRPRKRPIKKTTKVNAKEAERPGNGKAPPRKKTTVHSQKTAK